MEGQIELKEGSTVKNKETNINEEYSKLPLRYSKISGKWYWKTIYLCKYNFKSYRKTVCRNKKY